MTIGQMIALTTAPIKNGIKSDPPANEKLQVEADVPEYLSNVGYHLTLTTLQASIEDHAIMALDFLIPVGEYSDVTFFKHETHPNCSFSPPIAPLDNQKNGWNCVYIYQETNEEEYNCLIQASLGQ
ncbi:hypothetical protein ACHAXS_013427 [Conticribra weissflogii]